MRQLFIVILFAAISFSIFKAMATSSSSVVPPVPLPEFTQTKQQDWLKSKPLTKADLSGHVVLIDIWTFACWNCYRSFPWLNGLEKLFKDQNFNVIGIHSPEFDYEKNPRSVLEKMNEFQLNHPVMIDNHFTYWNALNNRYWPTFYLVDKFGNVRHRFIGETHADTQKSKKIEAAIRQLLAE